MDPTTVLRIEHSLPFKFVPFEERFLLPSKSEPSLNKLPKLDVSPAELRTSTRGAFVAALEQSKDFRTWDENTPRRLAFERTILECARASLHTHTCTHTAAPPHTHDHSTTHLPHVCTLPDPSPTQTDIVHGPRVLLACHARFARRGSV